MSATYPPGIFEDDLPPLMKELAQVIGLDAVVELSKKYGGAPLIIPRKMFGGCTLPEVIGLEATEKLIQYRAGTKFYIPKLDQALRVKRNWDIIRRFDAGENRFALARAYNLSVRHLERILKMAEPARDERQMALF